MEGERGNSGLRHEECRTHRKTRLLSLATDIERDDLVYSVNEPDNYAVEEALQIRDRVGGNVTVVTVGGEDDEERSCAARWPWAPTRAYCSPTNAFSGSDGRGIATILKAFVQKGHYDLILTGVQAEDGAAQVGGMLAAMLDYPFASLVNSIDGGSRKAEDQPRDRRRQQGDQRDRSALRALHPDRHQ